MSVKLSIVSYSSVLTYVLCAQINHLFEIVLSYGLLRDKKNMFAHTLNLRPKIRNYSEAAGSVLLSLTG